MQRSISPGLSSLEPPPRSVSREELKEQLATHSYTAQLLGAHYGRLATSNDLTEDLLPLDWNATESELAAIMKTVVGFSTHQPIRTGFPRADIYATLAEIEGFAWLIQQGYDRVEALPYHPIRGGTTPDARCHDGESVRLYEIKSFMAYWERRRHQLKTIGPNTLSFGARPAGRSVPDAERRRGGPLEIHEYNTLVVARTVERLLDKARSQLVQYARTQHIAICAKGILVVVTRYGSSPSLIRAALRAAKTWHARRTDINTVTALPEDICQALATGL